MPDKNIELFVPAITPFDARGGLDLDRLVSHANWLLTGGAHGLAPFGTTSEANSLTVAERRDGLEALLEAGISADRLIPGTGCCSVGETAELSAHATSLGCKGVLMLPPFYYKGVAEDGVFEFFAQTIESVGPDLKVYLYHIPQMSGVPITLGLIARLIDRFGDQIAGLKDSSGDWSNTAAVIAKYPQIDTYSASEALIPENASAGGAGCISASSNVNPRGIIDLIEALGTADEAETLAQVSSVRTIFEGLPLIPAIKAAVALQAGDPGFGHVRPPLIPLAGDYAEQIEEAVRLCGERAPQ